MSTNLFFIDSRVPDLQSIVAALPTNADWFSLRPDEDGLQQMASALQAYSSLDSIQIVSHGTAGALYLGGTTLDSSNLPQRESVLHDIDVHLSSAGEFRLNQEA